LLKEALTENPKNVLALCLALCERIEPDLQEVIEAWPDLTDGKKRQIKKLIEGQ